MAYALYPFVSDVGLTLALDSIKSLMAAWMSGAEAVATAKKTLFAYCTRKPAGCRSFLESNLRANGSFKEGIDDLPIQNSDDDDGQTGC